MEQLNFITNLLGIKDPNITILDVLDTGTHKEIMAKLDYPAPKCPHCQGKMTKYDFQKESKIPYLECVGHKTLIRLKKRRFRCTDCGGNGCIWDFLSQEEPPNRNHRQAENSPKIDRENPYDCYRRKFICIYFHRHS